MVARVSTVAFQGIEGVPVEVQVMIAPGKVGMQIVGLPDKAVAESRERVQAALHASGLALPGKRVTVNLAPADLPKEGSHFDLPIALALMVALGAIPADALSDFVVVGELNLDGTIAAIAGALPAAIGANALGKGLICPAESGAEAAWAGAEVDILAPRSLIALANHFRGTQVLSRPEPSIRANAANLPDLAETKGQESAKRALEVAAAGGHNLLMVGPPGSGKSMLASRLPSILPPLSPAELLEVSMVHSIAGQLTGGKLSDRRPFRTPHHSATMAALVGGGLRARPGEASLAHHGVLFLDEFPEFTPQALDALRQPLEGGECVIARANHRVSYPAKFQLIAAMNPCRCGMAGEPGHTCARGPRCMSDYQARISGPLMDRIDIRIDVPAVSAADLIRPMAAEASADVARRVARARELQQERFARAGARDIGTNARCSTSMIEKLAEPDASGLQLLRDAAEKMKFSARGYHRVLKVARTLADLDDKPTVGRLHLAEAISYRIAGERLTAAA
ncbi:MULTISPECIES: YifB family Mg chelatase-like AAA ATPase [Rhizobium]|uniref:YifB family Mg chelatase-like AAA ATPase n=1 Tax=Rhizobium TaxID=379 RepID=UPI001B33F163|nr:MULTISPECIES: YifB family Mg chelatase-like AAA ATPase [Rhizobium]MBX4909220.1 YifB family Mg chelatase-like AAA ATPase [Rhizobium bangladeshense]MBX5214862.1 YifB family Mg chelatase-like AAA ATPase [Rhizobium sp. NLR9a]MBX5232026.1 YifB family Mg chelatase-like AAA ATPase [Rhizobium sp. NLR4a]MBX5244277.1 YifB family Mg chelatase-like AAA ATPase [Rhizobium sp. NLR3b]MBX5249641.1 YifB family Mg chelatase-like AAA ATPase [Rhizobium sp. NLR4b]